MRGRRALSGGASAVTSERHYGNPMPYVMPAALALFFLIAGSVARALARDSWAWSWSVLVALTGLTLTWLAWRASRPRGFLTNILATVGTGLGSFWAWYVAGIPAGHLTWRPYVVWLLGAIVGVGGSWFLTALKEGQSGTSMHDRLRGAVAEVKNLNAIHVDRDTRTITAGVQMELGTPFSALGNEQDTIAALAGVRPGGVRTIPSPDHAGEGKWEITPFDDLAEPRPWPGPSKRPGEKSFIDPIVVGTRRGNRPLQFWLPGDPRTHRNAAMARFTGMPGAGKSVLFRLIAIEILACFPTEVVYDYWNPRKADQEPPWVRRGAASWASTKAEVAANLKALRDDMPDRARALGRAGFDQWLPGAPIPARVVFLDEFAGLASEVESIFVDLSETLRSLGVFMVAGFQRGTGDRMPTSARNNFGIQGALGCERPEDAEAALPESVIDEGAAPERWGARHPGKMYLVAPGIPEEQWSEEARVFAPDPKRMEQWAEHLIAWRGKVLESGTVSAPVAPVASAPAASATPAPAAPATDEEVDEVDEIAPEDEGVIVNDPGAVDIDDLEPDGVNYEAEIRETLDEVMEGEGEALPELELPAFVRREVEAAADAPELSDDTPGNMSLRLTPKMNYTTAQRVLLNYISSVFRSGVRELKIEEFGAEVLSSTGMSRQWLTKWVRRMCTQDSKLGAPILNPIDGPGWYRIVRDPEDEPVSAGVS